MPKTTAAPKDQHETDQDFETVPADDGIDLETATLSGDLRDAMLTRIRNLQKPWAQMTEAEQYDCANVLGDYVGQIVVMIMADSDDFMGERAPFEATPDAPELPIDAPEAVAAE